MIEITLVVLIVVLIGVIFLLYKKMSDMSMQNDSSEKLMKIFSDSLTAKMTDIDSKIEGRMNDVKEHVSKRLSENVAVTQRSTTEVNDRLTNASKVIGELHSKISAFEEGSKRIFDIGKDITELQNVFRAPKLRGGFGEWMLSEALKAGLMPNQYKLQYMYKSGDIVDAVVMLPAEDYFLPIDAKFPNENFKKMVELSDEKEKEAMKKIIRRDIQKHIDDIAKKYISKQEGSLDVALMYIPSENLYYETVIRDDDALNIREDCAKKRVIPVSPNTLYAYLQIITLGMKGMQVSKRAKEILDTIKKMEAEFTRVIENYDTVGKHIANAQSKYQETNKYMTRFETTLKGAIMMSSDEILEPPDQPKLVE